MKMTSQDAINVMHGIIGQLAEGSDEIEVDLPEERDTLTHIDKDIKPANATTPWVVKEKDVSPAFHEFLRTHRGEVVNPEAPTHPTPESNEAALEIIEKSTNSKYGSFIEEPEPPTKPYRYHLEGNYVEPGEGAVAENIIHDYVQGAPLHVIEGKYGVSTGQVYSHLNAAGVTLRKNTSMLTKKLAHLTLEDYDIIAKEYVDGVPNTSIYVKHNIHKNGLYYILDTMGVDRKRKK